MIIDAMPRPMQSWTRCASTLSLLVAKRSKSPTSDQCRMCEQIAHFFQHYKDLETGKWTTIGRWADTAEAERLVMEGIARGKSEA